MKIKPEELQKIIRWTQEDEDARKKTDWKWFQYDLWVSGLHYATYDRETNQIVSKKSDGRPKVVINKIYTTLRAVRNYTLRNRPKAEVTPHWMPEKAEALANVSGQNKFLDYIHDSEDMRYKLKGTVWDALKYSVGYWQILWDPDAEDMSGKGKITINDIDPYDLFWDFKSRNEVEARRVTLEVRRNIEDLKHDPKYDQKEVALLKGDKKLSASSLKERFLRYEMGNFVAKEDDGSVIVKEVWHKEWTKENKHEIWVTTIADNRCIRHEKTDLSRLPFFVLRCDINPRSFFGQGWVKNLISPNKELNRVMSHIAEWNHIMNRGKWIADIGSGVKIINNDNGQIIQKKRGYEVKQGNIAPLSPIAFNLKDSFDTYIEDIGGFHEASMGRIPPGARSGDAVEALQAGDANNLSEIVENTEDFLEEVFEYILSLAAEKYQFAREITPLSSTGQREYIKVIGEEAAVEAPEGAVVLPKKALVDVKITSWLANTPEARQKKAAELFQMQAIDEQTLLEFYEVGNVADVVRRVQEKKEKEREQELEQQKQMMNNQAEASREPTQQAGTQQAIAALRSLLQGEQPILPNVASPEFLDYIDYFLESEESLTPEQRRVIQMFRDQVAQTAGRPFNK
jgi:hypothetical protein